MKSFLLITALLFGCHGAFASNDTTLAVYTGKYVFPASSPTPEAVVAIENGTLTISSSVGGSALVRIEGDVFSIVDYNGTATFRRDAEGKIVAVRIVVQDLDMEGTKESVAARLKPVLPFRY